MRTRFLIPLMLACQIAGASTYYVATNGVASGPGTQGAPWTLTYALANAGPNNTIVLMDGGPYGQIDLNSANQVGLTIVAQHKWQAFIAQNIGDSITTEFGVSNCAFSGINCLYSAGSAMKFYAGAALVDSCHIAGVGRTPGWTTNNSGTAVGAGIYISPYATTNTPITIIQNCLIESNGIVWGLDQGIYLNNSNTVSTIIRGNVIREDVATAINFSDTYPVSGVIAYNNLIYGNGRMAGPGEGKLCIYANAVNSKCTNYFFNNIIINGGDGTYPAINCYAGYFGFSNNIIASPDPRVIVFQSGATGVYDYNLFTNAPSGGGGTDGGHNVLASSFGFENAANGLFWPLATSPVRGKAVNQPPPVDFFGNAQVSINDIGPFQYNARQAADGRIMDPSPSNGADYWGPPGPLSLPFTITR